MRQIIGFIGLIIAIISCVPPPTTSNNQATSFAEDKDFDQKIGLVQLFPASQTSEFQNPIIELGETLNLSFDYLSEDYVYMTAKISRRDASWQKSVLNDLEFLMEVNDFPINQYEFSQSTVLPYTRYSFTLPTLTKTGNYVITVFDEDSQPIFSRRFIVYRQLTEINPRIIRSTKVNRRNLDHQINFTLSYGNLEVVSPTKNLRPVILQNFNWNNSVEDLSPTSSHFDTQSLKYEHFNGENSLPALNDFRFFDFRALSYRGQNVANISTSSRGVEVMLTEQVNRGGNVFAEEFQEDLNGSYFLKNLDPGETDIQSEYCWINFKMKSPTNVGNLYITGKFNRWILEESNRLSYNSTTQSYEGSLLLKQGFYNYLFWVDSELSPIYEFEGSHFQAKNNYQLIIYYRAPGTLYDQVVGFSQFSN